MFFFFWNYLLDAPCIFVSACLLRMGYQIMRLIRMPLTVKFAEVLSSLRDDLQTSACFLMDIGYCLFC